MLLVASCSLFYLRYVIFFITIVVHSLVIILLTIYFYVFPLIFLAYLTLSLSRYILIIFYIRESIFYIYIYNIYLIIDQASNCLQKTTTYCFYLRDYFISFLRFKIISFNNLIRGLDSVNMKILLSLSRSCLATIDANIRYRSFCFIKSTTINILRF